MSFNDGCLQYRSEATPDDMPMDNINSCNYFSGIYRRTKADFLYRYKVLYTMCLYLVIVLLGWCNGQFGPSFLDLQIISRIDLEQGSWIMTGYFIGFIAGSLAAGVLYNKITRSLQFSICLGIQGALKAVIPWCSWYSLMISTHVAEGVIQGILGTAVNAEILMIWKDESDSFFIGTGLVYYIGNIISPLVTAPFLVEKQHSLSNTNGTLIHDTSATVYGSDSSFVSERRLDDFEGYIYNVTTPLTLNLHNGSASFDELSVEAKLFIPYSITGGLCIIISMIFVAFYFAFDSSMYSKTKIASKNNAISFERKPRKLATKLKCLALFIMGMYFFVSKGIIATYASFLNVFCVEHLSWSKQQAATLTSVLNIMGVISSVSAIFLSKCINSIVFLGLACILVVASCMGTLISSLHFTDIGIWVSVSLIGFANPLTFVLAFTMTNTYMVPVSGRVTSLFLVTSMIGSSVNSILMSYLMEGVSLMWFCYLFVIEGIILLIIHICASILIRCILKQYGKTYKENETNTSIQIAASQTLVEFST